MINRSLRPAALLSATARRIPGVPRLLGKCAGNTRAPDYCYGVWMRHLSLLAEHGEATIPKVIAELGPGPSLGTVLAALLSGAEKSFAFDVSTHANSQARNLDVFAELIKLFAQRTPISSTAQFSKIRPNLNSYHFPHDLLPEAHLNQMLAETRLERIRQALRGQGDCVRYVAPWNNIDLIEPESLDLIFSQAVLEHADDLPSVYRASRTWLRLGGFISHQIDFRCHGTARHWNGHYTYSDSVWAFLSKARPYLINREPYSTHLRLLAENGFKLIYEKRFSEPSLLRQTDLATRFQDFDDTDLTTSGVYLLAQRIS